MRGPEPGRVDEADLNTGRDGERWPGARPECKSEAGAGAEGGRERLSRPCRRRSPPAQRGQRVAAPLEHCPRPRPGGGGAVPAATSGGKGSRRLDSGVWSHPPPRRGHGAVPLWPAPRGTPTPAPRPRDPRRPPGAGGGRRPRRPPRTPPRRAGPPRGPRPVGADPREADPSERAPGHGPPRPARPRTAGRPRHSGAGAGESSIPSAPRQPPCCVCLHFIRGSRCRTARGILVPVGSDS